MLDVFKYKDPTMNKESIVKRFEQQALIQKTLTAFKEGECSYSYSDLYNGTNDIVVFLQTHFKGDTRDKKVLLLPTSRVSCLKAVCAAFKTGVELLIADHTCGESEIAFLINSENPLVLLGDGVKEAHPMFDAPPYISIGNKEATNFEHSNEQWQYPVQNASFFLTFFQQKNGGVEKHRITEKELLEGFKLFDSLVSLDKYHKYLVLQTLELSQFVMEALWVLVQGGQFVQVLSTNDPYNDIKRLIPTAGAFPMQFSLFYFGSYPRTITTNDKYKMVLDSVRHGDKNGYSAVWTPERHFNEFGGLFPNPSVLSAALATITEQIQLRCGSIVSPLHHSVRIAEDWSVIDNLSHGRASVSFASGWQSNDFIFNPKAYPNRHEMMHKQIREVKRLWKGESIHFKDGLEADIPIQIFPRPVQKELPIWVTVSGKTESFVDAGKMGANILTHLLWQDTDQLIEKIQAYRKSLSDHGYDPDARTVSVMVHTYVGKEDATTKEIVREPLKTYIRSSVHLIESMVKQNNPEKHKEAIGRYGTINGEIPEDLLEELLEIAYERFYEFAGLLGDADRCRTMIKKLRAYGVDELACLIDFGLEPEDVMGGLDHLTALKKTYDQDAIERYRHLHVRCGKNVFENLAEKGLFKENLPWLRSLVIHNSALNPQYFHSAMERKVVELHYRTSFDTETPLVVEKTSFKDAKNALYASMLEEGKSVMSDEF